MELKEFTNKLDWHCTISQTHQHDMYYAELEHSSPLGEDVIDCFYFTGYSVDSFMMALEDYFENAKERYDDDAELYIRERPRGTEHFTARELVDDADDKYAELEDYVSKARELYERIN